MNLILLIKMIDLAANNQNSKNLSNLALQLAVDPDLDDIVTVDSFSTEVYSAKDIEYIEQCINFKLT